MTVATGREQSNRDNKKLTKVLSTKLSIDDYNRFVINSKTAHAQGIIDEPTPSRFLRYIASDFIEGVWTRSLLLLPGLLTVNKILDYFWHLTTNIHDRHPIIFSSTV